MIIGLSGHIKSGKSTAATIIKQQVSFIEEKYFAYKLKYIASILSGDNIKNFESQEGKDGFLGEWNMTRRKMLQQLGTESLRNHFHDEVWIKSLFADYKPIVTHDYKISDEVKLPIENEVVMYPNWIISDVRFVNEAKSIKERGGLLLRINRPFSLIYPEQWNDYEQFYINWNLIPAFRPSENHFIEWIKINHPDLHTKISHQSETALDDYNEFDLIIDNVGTMEDFQKKIKNFLIQHNLS